jgi:hypothetical protein
MDTVKVLIADKHGNEREALMLTCPLCGYSSFHAFVVGASHNHLQCTHCTASFCQGGCGDTPTMARIPRKAVLTAAAKAKPAVKRKRTFDEDVWEQLQRLLKKFPVTKHGIVRARLRTQLESEESQ